MSEQPVFVRMYRKLLGDCFLITIGDSADRDERVHILIDCGVLQNVPGERPLIEAVAKDLSECVGGRLDLLVVTHEHWDHISGFSHQRDVLIRNMEIGELWLAWTERRGDPTADAYRAKSQSARQVVALAAEKVGGPLGVTGSVEDFNGPLTKEKRLLALEIIPALIDKMKAEGETRYLEPGQVLDTPGRFGLRANVLGPPRNPKFLMQDMPSSGSAKETYLTGNFARDLALRYAEEPTMGDALRHPGRGPFPKQHQFTEAEVKKGTSAEKTWLRETYLEDNDWRTIGSDWLDAAGALALKLDSDTNNTSLVLAFELGEGGDVLLFAADAQVGNWLSWHEQAYARTDGGHATARDLLGRTVLYKVGHHGSHNATLRPLGLELMTHPGLVAMIPVVEAEAYREKDGKRVHRGWNMPFPDLLTALLDRTAGRVVRGDAPPGFDPKGERICDDKAFLSRVREHDLYHEYQVR